MAEVIKAKVAAVLVSHDSSGISVVQKKIQVFANEGVRGDRHYGSIRLLDVRERTLKSHGLAKGMQIANFRQFSAVSKQELEIVAAHMGFASIAYGLLGENIVFDGAYNLTSMPSGTMILFEKVVGEPRTAALYIHGENTPCEIPAGNIASRYSDQTPSEPFQKAAIGKRGVVGVIYSSGFIHEGDTAIFKLP
jgi:hypothetical protein